MIGMDTSPVIKSLSQMIQQASEQPIKSLSGSRPYEDFQCVRKNSEAMESKPGEKHSPIPEIDSSKLLK